jgi:hypothetical protein
MNRSVRTALAFMTCIVIGSGLASAQARTWVSGVGDDVNPCSRTAPCKTFAGAISKTVAPGEISVLDPGGYGAVNVTKTMTISGDGSLGAILANGGGNGILVNGAGVVLTLRNISLVSTDGTGVIGVRLLQGAAAILEHVTISGFQTGLRTDVGNMLVIDSTIVRNTQFAVHAFGGSISLENSTLSNNNVAVQVENGATVNLSNNGIYNNKTGFGCGAVAGGILSTANNNRKGNNVGGVVPVCNTNAVMAQK